jgi:hypothetical protein
MRRVKRSVAAVVVPIVIAAGAVSWAGTPGAPRVEQLQADVVFRHLEGKVRFCTGADGAPWTEAVFTATGTSTGDPRLTGDVFARFSVLDSQQTGGYAHGWLRISDPRTKRWTAQGRFYQSEMAEIDQGIIVGTIRSLGRRSAEPLRLFAGIRTLFVPSGTFTAQIGGELPDGRLPATATGGRCPGPFEQFVLDVPPPDENARGL